MLSNHYKGHLYTLEGIEGCGKSTVLNYLQDKLPESDYLFLHEPGSTKAGEDIRNLILNKPYSPDLAPETNALLFAASRAELNDKVLIPELKAGKNIIIDRYITSSIVYQGCLDAQKFQSWNTPFTELKSEQGRSPEKTYYYQWVKTINNFIIYPDLIFYLDVPVSLAEKRIRQRKADNYLDKESIKVQEQRKKYFDYLTDLKSEQNHIIRIDCTDSGSERSVEEIGNEILNLIQKNENENRGR